MMMDINSSYSYALHSKSGNGYDKIRFNYCDTDSMHTRKNKAMSRKDSVLELLSVSLDESLDDLVEFFDGLDVDWDTVTVDELVESLEYIKKDRLSRESRLSLDCEYLTYVYEDLLADGEKFSPEGLLNFIKHNKSTGIDFYNTVIYEYIYNKLKHDGLIGCEYDEI